MKSESEIQKQCLQWLQESGFFATKMHLGAIRVAGRNLPNPMAGAPDIFALKNGKYHGIEVKKPGGKLSKTQKIWHQKALLVGGVKIIVVYSLDELIDYFS
ncbi:hypothetical protein CMK18_22650 [Candidatus Poribacteria bacterium]|nr:hypothetical protein [Candidatus Poribacteria bacterium]|tara:strand:- start:813 stop:1115 length:303 start_codon:yes stop_codon:yes gene_type:complete